MRNILGRTARTLAIGISITIFLAPINLGYAQLQQNATPIIIQSPPIIMQQPSIPTGGNLENQPPGNFANQTTELIVAFAAAVGAVASLALAVLNRMGLFKNKEAVTEDRKRILEETGIKMEGITRGILATRAQLNRLKPSVVGKIGDPAADPDTDPDLPREDTVRLQ